MTVTVTFFHWLTVQVEYQIGTVNTHARTHARTHTHTTILQLSGLCPEQPG